MMVRTDQYRCHGHKRSLSAGKEHRSTTRQWDGVQATETRDGAHETDFKKLKAAGGVDV